MSPQTVIDERLLVVCWLVMLSCLMKETSAQTQYTEKIPIGALFDDGDNELRSAYSYEMLMQNKLMMKFKLSSETLKINTDDSYAVGSSICQLMANGVFAFFASHTAATISTIRSYSSTFHMPFIMSNTAVNLSSGTNRPADLGYELYVRPHYARAIVDVIQHYGWKDIWYLYNSDEGLERLQQLLDALTDEGEVVIQHVYRVIDANDAFQTLQRLDSRRDESSKHVLIDLPTKQCEQLLNKQSRDTRGMQHHYFVIGLGVNDIDLSSFKYGGMNVTGFRIVDNNNHTVRNFLQGHKGDQGGLAGWEKLDPKMWPGAGHSEISTEAALAVDAMRVIAKGIQAVLHAEPNAFKHTLRAGKVLNTNDTEGIDCDAEPVIPWIHGYKLMKAMREVEFAGLTGTVKFDKFGLRRDYKLDVLEVSLNRGLAHIGSWMSGGLFVQRPNLVRQPKGENVIANKTRIITSIIGSPYFQVKKKLPGFENEPDEFEGYCVDLAKQVANIVGFQFMMQPVKDKMYGKREADGTWNGMVGELVRREADIAIAPLTITADRERVIDFSKPFMSLGISIMIKKPTKENPGVFSFMNPLSYEIWMCVIFAYIGVSVVLFLVSRFSPFEWHIEDHTDGPSVTNNFTIFNSLWFSLGAFMQQGCDIEPRSMSGRIVGSVWWFFTLIVISSYTANLAAFLTVERMQSPIESAEDLAKQTEIKYGTVDSGTTREFFRMSSIPVYERMWAFMTTTEPSVFVSTNEEGIARVRQGKYAFLIESVTNDYHNQRKPCDTMKVGSNLDSKGYGIATPLGSDLRDRITLAVLELSEKEELAKLEKEWWYEKGECGNDGTPKKQEVTSSLKLPNVAGIFYILMGGLVLALLMATFEFLYKSKVEARRKKTTFGNAIKSKARLSITGVPERQTSSYTYTPTAQLISLDGYTDTNTHTQV